MGRSDISLRKKATELRKQGLSYSEIKKIVPVSKSTLSLWLRNIKLKPEQYRRLKEKMKAGQPYAAKAHKELRIKRTKEIIRKAKREIGKLYKRELFYMGIMLYWAEGSKQKINNPSQRVTFNNSDPKMIKLILGWLINCLSIHRDCIDFEIYSHTNIQGKENEVVNYWSKQTGFSRARFNKIYYKEDKKRKYRKNQGKNYYGLLRINIRKSTDLNRKIYGWIEGICEQCQVT